LRKLETLGTIDFIGRITFFAPEQLKSIKKVKNFAFFFQNVHFAFI